MQNRTNEDILKGSYLMVFLGSQNIPIAFSTSNSISFTTNTTEVSTKDHGLFPATIAQSISWEVQCENLASDIEIERLFKILNDAKQNKLVTIQFAKPSNWDDKGIIDNTHANWTAPSKVLAYGNALLTSLSINAPAGDNASLSATFTGVGEITLADDNTDNTIGTTGPTGAAVTGPTGPADETGQGSTAA